MYKPSITCSFTSSITRTGGSTSMTATTMQQTPAVPPRPSRSTEKDISAGPIPKIPPRPINKHLERSVSPSAGRFAPSPLHEGIVPKAPKGYHLTPDNGTEDPIDRSGSVAMPSVGEEGAEYGALTEELQQEQEAKSRSASPEQTRHIGDDLKLHAPKPSLPALSAKQRVMAVTRTDSDKAASYGIGRPSDDRAASRDGVKKRPSSIYSNTSDVGHHTDDEHGIPEIGQRVPMNPHLGDVQAPSPAPGSENHTRRHHRKHSSRSLPPGSYGLHGHGVAPQDKLEKAYYEKHPELREKEHHHPLHDRQNDYAMSSSDLNKLVRDTANRAVGMGAQAEVRGTPTDEAAFQASTEYASRISTPRPASNTQKAEADASSQDFKAEVTQHDEQPIHVDDSKHPEFRSYGEAGEADNHEEQEYNAPILASDEVGKDPNTYLQHPAVHPPPERRGSAFEMEDAPSRPISRPGSIHNAPPPRDFDSTPLEDVKEYEPLFPEDSKAAQEAKEALENKHRHHFPSKDIWEDAPNSVHFTAEVSTPEAVDAPRRKSSAHHEKRPITPAQAFALHQEELAEKTAKGTTHNFLPLSEEKRPTWVASQPQHLRPHRPSSKHRFPSRDVWEDAPESQLHETTLSGSGTPSEESKPEIPARPSKKSSETSDRPSIPERPKAKQQSSEEALKTRPSVSEKPKPQIPARPAKSSSGDSKEGDAAKQKPPVPSRPVGGKIAALQAGFMSDLNKRLQLGPQAPKKEEPTEQQDLTEEKDKAPLSDARKSRARGPQRRAPAKSPAPPATTAESSKPAVPTLSFSVPLTSWAIDPEEGSLAVKAGDDDVVSPVAAKSELSPEPEQVVEEPVSQSEQPVEPEQPEQPEPEPERVEAEEVEEDAPISHPKELARPDPPETEQKTLVTNTAGESILEETVQKKDDGNTVEPVHVSDQVQS
ncbi:hypothetical protein HJFPF1_09030 [Paramyrothecium foliicola]|nr:hypothetical protein HJFPF1_09030 [Paramyrothecium foliicola]